MLERCRGGGGGRRCLPVNHVDHGVRLIKVVPPVSTDCLLAPNVPDVQLEIVMLQRLDVKALRAEPGV